MNIFFSGFAGSGKSYCANYLVKKYSYTPAKMAYPVYMIAEKYMGMTNKDRLLLQIIGTDVGRDLIDENIWIQRFYEDTKIAEETAKRLGKTLNLVSDDVRFPNEFQLLSEMGWVGIWLDVPEDLRIKRLASRDGDAQVSTLQHKSELLMTEFKDKLYQLDSTGTLEQTYEKLEQLLEHIRREKALDK